MRARSSHGPSRARRTRQEREDHNAAGHVPYSSWCRACVAQRGGSDAHPTSRSLVSATTTFGIDYGYLEDKVTLGEQEAGPSFLPPPSPLLPVLVTRSSTTQVTTADVLSCKGTAHPWCVQALVRAIAATGDAKIILRSDNERAILDLKTSSGCRMPGETRNDGARTDRSRWVDTAPKTERESVPKAASCLVLNLTIGKDHLQKKK